MDLIHLELHADHDEPDWAGMGVRLAATSALGAKPGADVDEEILKRGDVLFISEDHSDILTRGTIEGMVRYLELAWEGDIEDGYRKTVGGIECLLVPDYSDEENGHHKMSRLNHTVTQFLEYLPGVLRSGGFSVS